MRKDSQHEHTLLLTPTVRRCESASDKRKFITMLWDLYKHDPNWVPPLMLDRKKLIDTKNNPFYQHADISLFLAEKNGRVVGRVAAIINHNHNKFHNDKTGFFGFFECENDVETARALLTRAEQDLKARGATSVQGPANPSSNDEYGLLINGFDRPPVMLMTYNPPYYPELLEACGYRKAKDLYAWLLSQSTARSEKLTRVVSALRERTQVTVRTLNPKRFAEEVQRIKLIYNKAWETNWGFVPMTDQEMDALAKDLKSVYDPGLVLFAEKNGETIGFALSVPDINQAFHSGPRIPKGPLNLPVGIWSLLTKRKKIDTVRILVLGVVPEFRGRGIDAMLYWETMERAKAKGYEFGEASWVLEDNAAMNKAAEMMHGERYKTYRVFEKEL